MKLGVVGFVLRRSMLFVVSACVHAAVVTPSPITSQLWDTPYSHIVVVQFRSITNYWISDRIRSSKMLRRILNYFKSSLAVTNSPTVICRPNTLIRSSSITGGCRQFHLTIGTLCLSIQTCTVLSAAIPHVCTLVSLMESHRFSVSVESWPEKSSFALTGPCLTAQTLSFHHPTQRLTSRQPYGPPTKHIAP